MLGHLVSTGHAAASEPDTRSAAAASRQMPVPSRQPGWFARLFAQIFHRR
jgi:hypothetical protein